MNSLKKAMVFTLTLCLSLFLFSCSNEQTVEEIASSVESAYNNNIAKDYVEFDFIFELKTKTNNGAEKNKLLIENKSNDMTHELDVMSNVYGNLSYFNSGEDFNMSPVKDNEEMISFAEKNNLSNIDSIASAFDYVFGNSLFDASNLKSAVKYNMGDYNYKLQTSTYASDVIKDNISGLLEGVDGYEDFNVDDCEITIKTLSKGVIGEFNAVATDYYTNNRVIISAKSNFVSK